jgi:hypothetical protein
MQIQKQGVRGSYNTPNAAISAAELKRFGRRWKRSMLQELAYSEKKRERWLKLTAR